MRHRPEVRKRDGRWRAYCPSCRSWWYALLTSPNPWSTVFADADHHARTGELRRP